MENKDHIKDLFSEKLGQFEAPVRPELWTGISSQLGTSATTASVGMSLVSKVLIGISIAASVAVTAYILVENKEEQKGDDVLKSSITQENKEDVETPSDDQFSGAANDVKDRQGENLNERGEEEDNTAYTPENADRNDVREVLYENRIVDHGVDKQDNIVGKDLRGEDSTERNTGEVKGEEPVSNEVSGQEDKGPGKQRELNIELPNTFTPNGDGINDKLFIPGLEGAELSDFNLIVLDGANKVVYQTTDINFEWNGEALNGDAVPAGNYIYYFTAKDTSGKTITKYSRLTVNRSR